MSAFQRNGWLHAEITRRHNRTTRCMQESQRTYSRMRNLEIAENNNVHLKKFHGTIGFVSGDVVYSRYVNIDTSTLTRDECYMSDMKDIKKKKKRERKKNTKCFS